MRSPAVAGTFYPSDRRDLLRQVHKLLDGAREEDVQAGPPPKAAILPHAAYVYSGPVAARGYIRFEKARGTIARVIMIGPSHRVLFRGIATSAASAWVTPDGRTSIDERFVAKALDLPFVQRLEIAHSREHSLEVHLPFLRAVLGEVALVPLVVGRATGHDVARLLDVLWGDAETIIVVSSDLSHYLDHASARDLDASTATAIESLDPSSIGNQQSCGRTSMQGLLLSARSHLLCAKTVDLRSSGDTAGPRTQVVGYGAFCFTEGGLQ